MPLKTKSVLNRLLKGFISGALASMGLIVITTPVNWADIKVLLTLLAFAGIGGGINGLLLAGQKWASWKTTLKK